MKNNMGRNIVLPLIAILAVTVTVKANVIPVSDPSKDVERAGRRANNFPDETQVNQIELQLRNALKNSSEFFDTSKCQKCRAGEEFEKGSDGNVISCKCVLAEFFHHDMKLTETTRPIVARLFGEINETELSKGLTSEERLYWPRNKNGIVRIPYTFESNFQGREVVQKAFDEYKKKTCIRFVTRTSQRNYIAIGDRGGCWAYVGRIGGRQEVSIGQRCRHIGVVEHELMHVLGFFHEQSRPDRDDYVEIRFENIITEFENNFDKMINVDSGDSEYDVGSVMHYGEYAFTKNGKKTIIVRRNPENKIVGQRDGFAQSDIDQINAKYCPSTTTTTAPATTPEVTTAKVTTPKVTTPEVTTPSEEKCENKYDDKNCEAWAEKGYCEHSFVFYMEEYCRKSCNFCKETETGLECGKRKIFDDRVRIVGGVQAIEGTIPWQASIRLGSLAWCGGSWIGGEYILTAAHCIEQSYLQYYSVFLGLHYTNPDDHKDSKHVVYELDKVVLHEAYNPNTMENDIALIKLKKPVQSEDHIIPVCLPDSSYRITDSADVTVSGWGDLSEEKRENPEVLMKVVVQVINRDQCRSWVPFPIADTMLCAGYENGEKDSCQGDSGGPLTEEVNGRYHQVGVVSWGFGCARRQSPGIYTEVSRFRNWIKDNSGI